jgi:hypothetical protein
MKIVNTQIHEIIDNSYELSVDCEVPKGNFVAVTYNSEDGDTRTIRISVMPLDVSDGGVISTNTGLFLRGDESSIHIILENNGREVDSRTIDY